MMGKIAQRVLASALGCAVIGGLASSALAGPRWKLIYYRQIGNTVNGGVYTVENHLFREDGSKGAGVGVTNQFNPDVAIWGNASADGWHRIEPDDSAYRDVRIYQPGVPTDQSPNFYHKDPAVPTKKYSFETHWLYVAEETSIVAHPTEPVYHYDLVNGLNSPTYVEPPGSSSDAFALTTWTQPIYQTFVVPPGINRIVTAKAWPVDTEDFKYIASIVRDNGGPISTWPAVGPASTSRQHSPHDFVPVAVNWALHQVPVIPGQRYALKVLPQDNMGCNAYATLNDNYPQGHLWLDDLPITDRDLCAVVVGVGLTGEPLIGLSPQSITLDLLRGTTPAPQIFTVANVGTGSLTYAISENGSWMSVAPQTGSSTGEADPITITFSNTHLLPVGTFSATVTVEAPGAANSPRNLPVTLHVQTAGMRADVDRDTDVDQADFGIVQRCLSGSGIAQPGPACAGARIDGDNDVDGADVDILLGCFTGPGGQLDPNCGG